MTDILSETESVCPECLARIPAFRVREDENVYLEKTCQQHGSFRTVIWRGTPRLSSWVRPKIPSFPQNPGTEIKDGCPYDCGLCSDHRQHTCSVLLEVTQRCDLGCPVCFADSGADRSGDWAMTQIAAWYERLLDSGGPFNIQLSGGEPCMRDDLPEIIQLGRTYGFSYFQINTNGLRLARDVEYLTRLRDAGLSTIYLQFDGMRNSVYQAIRGRALLDQKLALISRCAEQEVGVMLVPTLIPGINTTEIGNIIRFALANMPTVRGVHFQPISYFGRYPEAPDDAARITIPEVIREIEIQTNGLISANSLCPPGCENSACSFHGSYILMPDGSLKALTRHKTESCCCKPSPASEGAAKARAYVAANWSIPSPASGAAASSDMGDLDVFLERKRSHTFCISGMAFQDAWNLDLERLRDCCIHVASPDGRLVPFCAYNLTNRQGKSLYRNAYDPHPA